MTFAIILIIAVLTFVVVVVLVASEYNRRLAKAHRAETYRLNAILNSIADGVIVQDALGEIETMNPSSRMIIDMVSRETPTKKDTEDLENQIAARTASLLNYLGGLRHYEPQHIEIGGRVLSTRSAPIGDDNGAQNGNVFVLRDITSEMEAKKLKDDFITTISHELRTPLAVIKSVNDLLRMNETAVNKTYRSLFLTSLDQVDENVTDLLNQIEQMLDMTQINAGALGVEQSEINIVEIVREEANRWVDSMFDRELIYDLQLPDRKVLIEGDEQRLTRVIYNLLKNAYNYTLPGGTIQVILKAQPDMDVVEINVSDTGVGISKRDQPFIFTRFFRAIHNEGTFEVSGAGLGLYLSKAIIEAHNGRIWFESKVDQGSTFTVLLPILSTESA